MSKASQFFTGFERQLKESIRTTMPGQIVRFDKENQTADVQPLYLEKLYDDDKPFKMPLLEDVPVISFRFDVDGEEKVFKQVYKEKDVVILSICDRDIDDLQKQPFLPDSNKMFSIKDAVIIGGWNI